MKAVVPLLAGGDDLGGEDRLGGVIGAERGDLGDDRVVAVLPIDGGFGWWREGSAEIVEQVVVGLGGEGVGEGVGVDGGGVWDMGWDVGLVLLLATVSHINV